jgi:hypothetical protein
MLITVDLPSAAATVARYWVYLAKTFTQLLPTLTDLDSAYREHVAWAFNQRAGELDLGIARLALFLDPRYRTAACGAEMGSFTKLLELVSGYAMLSHIAYNFASCTPRAGL